VPPAPRPPLLADGHSRGGADRPNKPCCRPVVSMDASTSGDELRQQRRRCRSQPVVASWASATPATSAAAAICCSRLLFPVRRMRSHGAKAQC